MQLAAHPLRMRGGCAASIQTGKPVSKSSIRWGGFWKPVLTNLLRQIFLETLDFNVARENLDSQELTHATQASDQLPCAIHLPIPRRTTGDNSR
jgi:hypothetical protein